MTIKILVSLFMISAFCCASAVSEKSHAQSVPQSEPQSEAQSALQSEPQKATLFSRITYNDKDYGRSAFNFRCGLRSDEEGWERAKCNNDPLLYGSISISRETDWFSVSMGGENPSRIKDLGERQWFQVYDAPVLPADPPLSTGLKFPAQGESMESSSGGRVSKVLAGHMYVVHLKSLETDFYAMFRVDSLEPSDHCTISWKIMPSPEKTVEK